MALDVGTKLGAFEITGAIGAGGMGEVYRATDTRLGRDVAIKTLPSALAEDPDRLARFEREAKLLASLNHAHIASVHSLDEHDGTRFIAMELVEGQSLEEKLRFGALPVEQALELALQIASALEAAHDKGVLHRDLKPANIMITPDGVVKVLDFGLAKALTGGPNAASPAHSPALSLAMTQQGLILGTAGYMSPEQAAGQATDQRTDIWAFGVVLYEMLTGQPLFSGESVPHIVAAVLQTEPDWARLPENLHPRLKLLLERCLRKKVRDRYHSVADVRVDVEDVLRDPKGATEVAIAPPPTRHSLPLAAALALGVAITGLIAWTLWPATGPRPVNRFDYDLPQGQALRIPQVSALAVSPDGRRFAFNATNGLYVREMNELEARPVPGTEEAWTTPIFSPDGRSVAYFSGTDASLKRIGISGGTPLVVTEGVGAPMGASWGSDGTILYGQGSGIFRVTADGGTAQLLIPAEEGELLYGPELLPDGDSVLFSVTTGSWDEAQIVAQSLSTGTRTVLVDGGADARYVPTGHLVYALGDSLFAVTFDVSRLAVSGRGVPVPARITRSPIAVSATANYGVSNDGTLFYVSGATPPGALSYVWVDREGREESLGLDPCACINPAVSPDGARVAFDASTQSGGAIFVYSIDRDTFTRLTFESLGPLGQTPIWTPDGTRIVYRSATGLVSRSADNTGAVESLIEGSDLVPWSWSVNGELIFTDGSAGSQDIGAVAMTGDDEPSPVLATSFNEWAPDLSPDGRWLAYQSDESGEYEIYVRPFPDVTAGRWQVSAGGGRQPRWSQDGRTLFFLGRASVMASAVERGPVLTFQTPRVIVDGANYAWPGGLRHYDLSPEGRRLLLRKPAEVDPEAGPTQIVVVTNWVQELESAN